jgi:hypothetical protein
MKITIYVLDSHIDTLYKYLGYEISDITGPIEWYHDRPGNSRYFMVTIDYNDFIKLDDRQVD